MPSRPAVATGLPPFWRDATWQEGVVTRGQVLDVGLTDSWIRARLDGGTWARLFPGVYLTHNGQPSAVAEVWAGVLYAGPGAAASHYTAAHLHGLIEVTPDEVHVAVPGDRRVRSQPGLILHRVATCEAKMAQRPPRTDIATTILDLAASAQGVDGVVSVVTRAYALRIVRPAALAAALQQRPRQRWRSLLQEMVRDVDGVESALEWRYRRYVERAHGLATPTRQRVVRVESALVRRDVDYEEYGVVIELDGRRGHEGVGVFRDAARDNAALLAGQVTLRYGWWDIRCAPCRTAVQVARVLQQRGWTGSPRSCGQGVSSTTSILSGKEPVRSDKSETIRRQGAESFRLDVDCGSG